MFQRGWNMMREEQQAATIVEVGDLEMTEVSRSEEAYGNSCVREEIQG
jgi:hypothetical protein